MEQRGKLLWRTGPLTCALLAGLGIATVALAHGGGLDKNGCHTNHKTGDYHCHGTPAPASAAPLISSSPTAPSGSTSGQILISRDAAAGARGVSERQLVLAVQLLLKSLGYGPAKPTGTLGVETASAIRSFQGDAFLERDGQLSGQLLVRLSEEVLRKNQ